MVTLRFSALTEATTTRPPARSISQASSVASPSTLGRLRKRAFERLAAEDLRRLHRPQARAIERLEHAAMVGHALDRVGHRRRGDRSIGIDVGRQRSEHVANDRRCEQRPCRVVHEHRVALLRDLQRTAHRLRARCAPLDADNALTGHIGQAGADGQRDDDLRDLGRGRERL